MTFAFPRIAPSSREAFERAQTLLDGKTKPLNGLGRLEHLAARLCAMQNRVPPDVSRLRAVIFAADHGATQPTHEHESISAFPREVTAQMLRNFAGGGAAVCALSQSVGAELQVVDVGVDAPDYEANTPFQVRTRKVRRGTRDWRREPAMTLQDVEAALQIGVEVGREAARDGVGALACGEMGIGNTASASALLSMLTNAPPSETVGRGTGLDDDGWARKIEVVSRALELHAEARTPMPMMCAVGGLEIAALAGCYIGAASGRVPVVVDGFIGTVAALWAVRACEDGEALRDYFVFSHVSAERGHALALNELRATDDLRPLLDFAMRLGEASGAVLCLPLLRAAASLFAMASFESAGVSTRN